MDTCLWKEPPQVSERVDFAVFDWKYQIFSNIKSEELNLKNLLFNYGNNLVLGSVETYFLEVYAYVSLKGVTASLWDGRFCWIWLELSPFLKYENGLVGSKKFIVELLKWPCLRLSGNILFGRRCILFSQKSHRRCVRGSLFLTLTWNITFFEIEIPRNWT